MQELHLIDKLGFPQTEELHCEHIYLVFCFVSLRALTSSTGKMSFIISPTVVYRFSKILSSSKLSITSCSSSSSSSW